MRGGRARRWAALAAVASMPAALLLTAEPAVACSCGRPDVDRALESGAALALVTRTDDDGHGGPGARVATFAVDASVGPDLPDTLTGEMDGGASCQPYVPPQGVAALVFERRGVDWHLGSCSEAELGPAIERVLGAPDQVAGGKPVAYLAGAFGGSRLAAVDAQGRPVAWANRGGHGEHAVTCPGDGQVVAVGRTAAVDDQDRKAELTIHDPDTLEVVRTVRLPIGHRSVLAMRCRDHAAGRVEILVGDDNAAATLISVVGDRIETTRIRPLTDAVPVTDGFLAVTDAHDGGTQPEVVHIGPDADVRNVAAGDTLGHDIGIDPGTFTVSPDERTVTVFGYTDGKNPLVTIDVRSGERVGSWSSGEDAYVTGVAWTRSGRLLVRDEHTYRQSPVPLLVFDRTLGEPGRWPPVPGSWGGRLGAVGAAAVSYGGTRLTVRPDNGGPLISEELRLAAAEHLVAVPGAEFAVPDGTPAPAPADRDVAASLDDGADTTSSVLPALTWLAGSATGAAVLSAVVLAVRRRSRAA